MTIELTPLARQWLAERRAEAIAIVTGGNAYTRSQREVAWTHLTGQQPHPRATVAIDEVSDTFVFDDGPEAA